MRHRNPTSKCSKRVQDKTSAHTHLFRNLKHRRALSARLLIPRLCCECFSVGVTIVTTFGRLATRCHVWPSSPRWEDVAQRRRKTPFVLYNCMNDEYVLFLVRDDFLCENYNTGKPKSETLRRLRSGWASFILSQ